MASKTTDKSTDPANPSEVGKAAATLIDWLTFITGRLERYGSIGHPESDHFCIHANPEPYAAKLSAQLATYSPKVLAAAWSIAKNTRGVEPFWGGKLKRKGDPRSVFSYYIEMNGGYVEFRWS